jgi:hypothetical protein
VCIIPWDAQLDFESHVLVRGYHRVPAGLGGDRTATAAAESTIGFDFPWLKEAKKSPRTDVLNRVGILGQRRGWKAFSQSSRRALASIVVTSL